MLQPGSVRQVGWTWATTSNGVAAGFIPSLQDAAQDEGGDSKAPPCVDTSEAMTGQSSRPTNRRAKRKGGVGQWLSRLKDWVTTSEPSAQALKQYKKIVYKNSGITSNDPQASAKLHIPIATIPPDAIQPASGPDPDDLARKKAQERRMKLQLCRDMLQSSSGSHNDWSQSMSSSAMTSMQGSEPRPPHFPM